MDLGNASFNNGTVAASQRLRSCYKETLSSNGLARNRERLVYTDQSPLLSEADHITNNMFLPNCCLFTSAECSPS